MWLFYREDAARKVSPQCRAQLERRKRADHLALTQLQGLRLNVGTAGSGVPRLMEKLFEANNIDIQRITLSQLEQTPATVAFLGGELDAIVFASAPESLMVQMLLQTPGVKLMDFAQSEAYSRRFPFLTPVVLPRGVVDLARDLPPPTCGWSPPPPRCSRASRRIPPCCSCSRRRRATCTARPAGSTGPARFPTTEHSEYPVSREAERAIKGGQPFLQRYLPFWLANLVERMWLALGIIIAILLPLSRIVPPLYEFRIRSRVFRWYGQLRAIENQMQAQDADAAQLAAGTGRPGSRRSAASACRCRMPMSFMRCATTSTWCGASWGTARFLRLDVPCTAHTRSSSSVSSPSLTLPS